MNVDIEVYRGLGENPGEPIYEPLLSTIDAALARGLKELNDATTKNNVKIQLPFLHKNPLPRVVRVVINMTDTFYCRVVSIQHSPDGAGVTTTLTCERYLI